MSKKCTHCGTILDDEAMFCSECGTKQAPVEKKCTNCGAVLMEGAKFCMYCGTPVAAAAASPSPVTPKAPKEPQTQKQGTEDFEISQPDGDTLSFNIMGIPFIMKFIKGGMVGNTEVSDFYIGETVVTQALWQTVMGDNPSKDNSDLQYPVTDITKQLANTFLIRLKKITGVEFAIPTSSQFKYVALKGSEKMGKDDFKETTWGDAKIHPVCGMMSNTFGLYDLSDWSQLVIDKLPKDDYYRFNPSTESGDGFAGRQNSLKTVDVIDLPVATLTLRLVINIPVLQEIEKAKKKLEDAAAESYENTLLFKIKRNGKFGYINKKGEVVLPCEYDDADDFSEGLAKVKVKDSYGYIDNTGEIIINCIFDNKAGDFSEGFARVRVKGKYGFINKSGQVVIPCKYDDAGSFSDGLARIKKGLFGYINTMGDIVIPCKYEDARDFHEGLSWVRDYDDDDDYDYCIYIDKDGNEVFTDAYACSDDEPNDFSEGLIAVYIEDDEFLGCVNQDGERVLEIDTDEFCSIGEFHEGLALVTDEYDEYGYIDKKGRLVIKCKYDDAEPFCDGLACVQENGKWGFIDKSGKKVIPCKYEKAENFHNGLARVIKNKGKTGYVDKTGHELGFE